MNYIPPNQTKIRHRFTAFFVLIAFLWDSIFAFPAVSLAAITLGSETYQYNQIKSSHSVRDIALPRNLGTVEVRYQGTEPYSVILVQDAHAIPDAQKAISKLISYFNHQYGVNLIATEGAAGKLDPLLFRIFPDRDLLKQVFEDSLHRGELSGVAVASVLEEKEADYYGIEEEAMYERAVGSFLAAVSNQPDILPRLDRYQQVLTKLKKKHYSSALFTLDQEIVAFEESRVDMADFLATLKKISETEQSFSLGRYPHLSGIFSKLDQTAPADAQTLEAEIRKLIREVKSQPLAEGDARKLHRLIQEYQTERISSETLTQRLLGMTRDKNISVRIPELLKKRMKEHFFFEQTKGTELFNELLTCLDDLKAHLFRSTREKILGQKNHRLSLFKKLIRLELTRKQWEELEPVLLRTKADSWTAAFNFYQLAEDRDQIFTHNLLSLMNHTNQKTALFVAGGYHTEGLIQSFKQKGISFLLVSPRVESIPGRIHYLDYMRGQVSWNRYFRIRDGRIDLYEA
ncbi:MAG TPA: hypothetical protein VD913_03330, partial [bacterium]|nr:hypothetical protein [bacterium]